MDYKFFVAVKALLYYDDKFLIVKRSGAARGEHHFWELPGGRMEFGETPEDALTREIMEETGLPVKIICPLQTWNFFRGDDTQIVGVTFLCKTTVDTVQLSDEHDAYAWITDDELPQYSFIPTVLSDIRKLDRNDVHAKLNQPILK